MRTTGGFTLLEMIVAMILLMLILFSIGVLIPYSQVRMKKTTHKDIAVLLAENMFENVRTIRFEDVRCDKQYDGNFSSPTPPFQDGSGRQIFPPVPYPSEEYQYFVEGNIHRIKYSYFVTASDVGTSGNSKKVSISVYWSEGSRDQATGSMEDMKSITVDGAVYRR